MLAMDYLLAVVIRLACSMEVHAFLNPAKTFPIVRVVHQIARITIAHGADLTAVMMPSATNRFQRNKSMMRYTLGPHTRIYLF